jgi:hypothetical protein
LESIGDLRQIKSHGRRAGTLARTAPTRIEAGSENLRTTQQFRAAHNSR